MRVIYRFTSEAIYPPHEIDIAEVHMKRRWRICRQLIPQANGQQRWNQAYQLLLRWSQQQPVEIATDSPLIEEVKNESGSLCSCLNPTSSPNTNHRPTNGAHPVPLPRAGIGAGARKHF